MAKKIFAILALLWIAISIVGSAIMMFSTPSSQEISKEQLQDLINSTDTKIKVSWENK